MTQEYRLSDLQIAIMRVLWKRREATVTDVHEDLKDERGLAPTTVATVLSRLEKRGLLAHRTAGRQFVYRPLVTEEQVRCSMVEELTELLFEGDVSEMVSHLLSAREISPGDLARVKSLIEARERTEPGAPDDPV